MKKPTSKLSLSRESIRSLTQQQVQVVNGALCGCSWTCTDDAVRCTVTQMAGGCHVTSMFAACVTSESDTGAMAPQGSAKYPANRHLFGPLADCSLEWDAWPRG